MARIVATVGLTEKRGSKDVDSEQTARTLEELYRLCREAPPSHLVRVSLVGPEGELRLHFASFIPEAE